jgi:hypothetical protein
MAERGDPVEIRFIEDKSDRMNASPSEYPPLREQAGNALKAAVNFVRSGFEIVNQAEFDRRRSICEGCEHMDKAKDKCKACGCALKAKPWSAVEQCPHGNWERPPAGGRG